MKKGIKVLSFIIPLILVVVICQNVVFAQNDSNTWRIKCFYMEEKNSLDVVLIGASDVFTGYSAGLAYNEFGYTSYPYASDSASIMLWKYQVEEIMRHQTPKVIMIEVNGALQGEEELVYNDARYRQYMDNIPFSVHKANSILNTDLDDDKMSYILPFVKYHSNLSDVPNVLRNNIYFMQQGYSRLKGFTTITDIEKPGRIMPLDKLTCYPLNKDVEKYLLDFIDYCHDKKLDNIVFTRFPHRITTEANMKRVYRCNQFRRIVTENGFDFIDFEEKIEDIGIKADSDYYNDDHLNCFGSRKLTHFIGDMLANTYSVQNTSLTRKDKDNWEASAKATEKAILYAEQCIAEQKKVIISETPELMNQLD